MPSRYSLPEKEDDLVLAIKRVVSSGEPYRNKERVRWLITSLYMQGERDFTTVDWINGSVNMEFLNSNYSDINFKYEGLLGPYQTELGRFHQLDFTPKVKPLGMSLDGLSKAGTAQIVLNDILGVEGPKRLKALMLPPFIKYGHIGVGAFKGNKDKNPFIELIPPWELLSIPAGPADSSGIDGEVRIRWMLRQELEDRGLVPSAIKIGKNNKYKFETLPAGITPGASLSHSIFGGILEKGISFLQGSSDNTKREQQQWGRLIETWIKTTENELERYVALVGEEVVADEDFKDQRVPMPINVARYLNAGGYYGRGLMEQLIGLNTEAEYMLTQLFRNVEDFDQLGILCLPRGMGITADDVREARRNSKALLYEPDVMQPDAKPFAIQPVNSGTLVTEVAKVCLDLMNTQSQQSKLFSGDAPGRVDNSKALSLLYETANIPLTGPTESIASAVIESYRSILWLAGNVISGDKEIPMTLTDDMLVGIEYDSATGVVKIDQNSIPSPYEITMSLGSSTPQSEAQLRSDLADALQLQIITPREYRFKARESGLDIPVGNEQEWQSYRKAKLENIQLYGNGKVPNSIVIADHDMHDVHLEVLSAFMARPEYPLASEEVRLAFKEHYDAHKAGLGTYADELPYPGTEEGESALGQGGEVQL